MNIKEKNKISNQIQQILFLIEKYKYITDRFNLSQDLKIFFKNNKFLGSRDRRLIQSTIYTYFKWKKWIDKTPSPYKEFIVFLFADLMDDRHKDYFSTLEEFKDQPETMDEAIEFISEQANISFLAKDLFPKWTHDKIDNYDLYELNMFISGRAPIWIRKFDLNYEIKDDFTLIQHNDIKSAYQLTANTNVLDSNAYKTGNIEIQDLGSQMIIESLPLEKNMLIWDVCAGAGGKTISIAKKLQNNCKILATDIREHSLKELIKRADRCHINSIKVELTDARTYDPELLFDLILIDAPCSASGTWRRNPSERWRLKKDEYEKVLVQQRRLLLQSSKFLKDDGYLVYSTCSIFNEENEEQIELFIRDNPIFRKVLTEHPFDKRQTVDIIKSDQFEYNSDLMFVSILKKS
jgi:16S rRNA (cytosine967-C5)-methyltransferase